jgi:diguanylate cyclase (GGDEF)-like protein
MPVSREKKIYRNFVLSTSIVIALVLTGVFVDMAVRSRELMYQENLIQARALFNTILLTREWNARYGGVYVEKKAGVESNPYLVNPDVKTVDGRVFTKRNPALMTREISESAAREGRFKFHLTSLQLLNPENKPDAFEREALLAFEAGEQQELSMVEKINNHSYFRYMAPLYVEDDCLQCHGQQNYKRGDVRGGISISFDIEDLRQKINQSTFWIIFFGIFITIILLLLIYFFTSALIKKLAEARMQIEKIAITDDLTGLFNRRHILDRFHEEFEKVRRLKTSLSCIIADIDHFKSVNDRFGHLAGDEVLKQVAHMLKGTIRPYDIVGRYGGEEFLIVLPDTGPTDARNFAERIRACVKQTELSTGDLTISLGVTAMRNEDQSLDDVIKRADEGLYRAKNAGRDRVEEVS